MEGSEPTLHLRSTSIDRAVICLGGQGASTAVHSPDEFTVSCGPLCTPWRTLRRRPAWLLSRPGHSLPAHRGLAREQLPQDIPEASPPTSRGTIREIAVRCRSWRETRSSEV